MEMFPCEDWPATPGLTGPLTRVLFIAKILVPEVAMRLILEDMVGDVERATNRASARQITHASAGYGNYMFPTSSDGSEALLTNMRECAAAKKRRLGSEDDA